MYCDLDLGDMTLGQVHDTPLEKANAKDRRQIDMVIPVYNRNFVGWYYM